jgi:hypothetical protein
LSAAGVFETGAGKPAALPLIVAAVAAFMANLITLVMTVRTGRGTRVSERGYLQASLHERAVRHSRGALLKIKNVGKSVAWICEYRIAVVAAYPDACTVDRQFQGRLESANRMVGAGKTVKLQVIIPWYPPQSWLLVALVYRDVFGKVNESWFSFSYTGDRKSQPKQDGYRRSGLQD